MSNPNNLRNFLPLMAPAVLVAIFWVLSYTIQYAIVNNIQDKKITANVVVQLKDKQPHYACSTKQDLKTILHLVHQHANTAQLLTAQTCIVLSPNAQFIVVSTDDIHQMIELKLWGGSDQHTVWTQTTNLNRMS
jgi:hypothetical protein